MLTEFHGRISSMILPQVMFVIFFCFHPSHNFRVLAISLETTILAFEEARSDSCENSHTENLHEVIDGNSKQKKLKMAANDD